MWEWAPAPEAAPALLSDEPARRNVLHRTTDTCSTLSLRMDLADALDGILSWLTMSGRVAVVTSKALSKRVTAGATVVLALCCSLVLLRKRRAVAAGNGAGHIFPAPFRSRWCFEDP